MTKRAGSRRLHRTIGWTAVAAAAVVVLGVGAIYLVTSRTMGQLSVATERFLEEQRTADQISQALVRQLVAASAGASRGDPEARRAFNEAGAQVYALIQGYLFGTLSADQRLQLETIKRQHQLLEVAAVRAADLELRGSGEAADEARTRMFDHASSLLAEVEAFMRMRQEGLEQLRDQQNRTIQTLFLTMGLVATAFLAGSLLAGGFLHRRVSKPLAGLVEASGRIGAGDLDVRVEPAHADEIGEVGRSFNRMAENLALAQQRLEARNEELADAVQSLRATQEELVQAEKMTALGRMIAGLAHELNNPLASVLSHVELLEAELRDGTVPRPDELRRDFIEPLLEEATRSRGLVLNLLRFSRKSEGRMASVPLRATLDVVAGLRRYAFDDAGIDLVLDSIPEVHVRAERQQLQDAFLNIVNNALEAMTADGPAGGERGELRVRATVDEERVRMTFDDTGPGLAEPHRIFEPFYTTKEVGQGTGLGLALVHRFVETCGGRVAAGDSPGGGARVEMELVLAEEPSGDDPEPFVTRRPASADPSPAPDEPLRILVVEDEPHLRRVQERLLRRLGAQPVLAASAAEAREILGREDVALVISDVRMPEETGIELYHWLEIHRPELAGRFLFVTGDIYNPDTRSLSADRPDLFIQKPFEMEEYLERVATALASHRGPDGRLPRG